VLFRLGGFPVLEWVIKRVLDSNEADVVVLAFPETAENDALQKLAEQIGCAVYRGSEHDVLKRLKLSVQEFQPDTVVRVCADRPFVDPNVLDDTVRFFNSRAVADRPLEIAFSHKPGVGADWPFGFGVEVLSFASLDWLDRSVTGEFEREHVTLHIWNNAEEFSIEPLPCPLIYSKLGPDYKLDLDTADDLARLRHVVIDGEDINLPGHVFLERAVGQRPPQ
jgi:spore coat polysaccharide biosynthesis protein SpsF